MMILLQFFCLFFMTLAGCAKKEEPKSENGKLKVLSTIAMISDLVKEIGQEDIESSTLILGDLDPHTYELVKGDDEKFFKADLIFHNGLGLEHGLSLRKLLEKEPKALSLGEKILEKEPGLILKMDGQYDPHIWMDISIWARVVDPIVEALCKHDPSHEEAYRMRGKVLVEKLLNQDALAFERLQKIDSKKRYLITTHNAFNYFTKRYLADDFERDGEEWKNRVTAPEGLAPDAEISLSDLKHIVDYVEKYQVSVLFPESNLNKDALSKIVSASCELGYPLRLSKEPIYGDAMGTSSYVKMMDHNIEIIAQELGFSSTNPELEN